MRVYIACLQPLGSLHAQTDAHTGMKRNGLVSTSERLTLQTPYKVKESGVFQNLPPRQDVA